MPNFLLSYKRAKVARRLQPTRGFAAHPPRSGQRTAEFPNEIVNGADRQKLLWNQGFTRSKAMKLFTMISAGLVLAAASAQAQSPSPSSSAGARYTATSDLNGPYADVPPAPVPGYSGPAYGGQGYGGPAYGGQDYGRQGYGGQG